MAMKMNYPPFVNYWQRGLYPKRLPCGMLGRCEVNRKRFFCISFVRDAKGSFIDTRDAVEEKPDDICESFRN